MTALKELQEAIAGAAERLGPSVVGLGRGWGLGSGVVDRHGPRPHERAQPAPRRGHGHVRRRRARATAGDGRGRDGDLAVVDVKTNGDAQPLEWAGQAEPGIGTAVIALANPGGRAACAPRSASSRRRAAQLPRPARAPHRRRRSSTPRRSPRGSLGRPARGSSTAGWSGLNSVRLDGGLILALPDAALRDARRGAWPAARRPPARDSAWPWRRRGWLGGCAARWACRERDGLLVREVRGGRPRRRAPASSAAT